MDEGLPPRCPFKPDREHDLEAGHLGCVGLAVLFAPLRSVQFSLAQAFRVPLLAPHLEVYLGLGHSRAELAGHHGDRLDAKLLCGLAEEACLARTCPSGSQRLRLPTKGKNRAGSISSSTSSKQSRPWDTTVNTTAGHAFRSYGHAFTLSPLAWERNARRPCLHPRPTFGSEKHACEYIRNIIGYIYYYIRLCYYLYSQALAPPKPLTQNYQIYKNT